MMLLYRTLLRLSQDYQAGQLGAVGADDLSGNTPMPEMMAASSQATRAPDSEVSTTGNSAPAYVAAPSG